MICSTKRRAQPATNQPWDRSRLDHRYCSAAICNICSEKTTFVSFHRTEPQTWCYSFWGRVLSAWHDPAASWIERYNSREIRMQLWWHGTHCGLDSFHTCDSTIAWFVICHRIKFWQMSVLLAASLGWHLLSSNQSCIDNAFSNFRLHFALFLTATMKMQIYWAQSRILI